MSSVPVANDASARKPIAPFFDHRLFPLAAGLLLGGIVALPTLRYIWHNFATVRGWEADSIARAIVGGHGYSFPGTDRWLWDKWNGDPNVYFPTAWADPVFTYILAGAHWLFGSHVYLAMYGFAFLCVAVLLGCAYRLAARFGGPWAGAAAIVVLAGNQGLGVAFFADITNSALSAAVVVLSALLWVRYFERPTPGRLVSAGLLSGAMVLTCPSMMYFLYLLPIALVALHWRNIPRALGHTVAALLLAAVVLTPWAIRNYLTFHEIVIVRNGAGMLTWEETVGPAQTFMPDEAITRLAPPWQSTGPRDSLLKMADKTYRLPMHRYTINTMYAAGLPNFEQMNEAQRDQYLMSQTKRFMQEHPLVIAEMAITKVQAYIAVFGLYGVLVVALAIAGAVYWIRDPRSWSLSLMAISFSALYLLALALYGRYRAPIEGVMVVLAIAGAVRVLADLSSRRNRASASTATS
jgi:4-amino-4-deoxy-L-arabinose transferase-like glycosyltransferase